MLERTLIPHPSAPLLLILLLASACQVTFDVAPASAPRLRDGITVTRDGEQHDTPDEVWGKVVWKQAGDQRYGTRPRVRGVCQSVLSDDQARTQRPRPILNYKELLFAGRYSVRVHEDGSLIIMSYDRGCVIAPLETIERVVVVHECSKCETAAAIAITSILVGGGIFASLVYWGLTSSWGPM